MSKDYRLYLEDIQKAAHKIDRYLEDTSFQEFTNDSMCRDAVLHNLDIVSASIERIPAEVRKQHPTIEWRNLEVIGDVIAHEYFGIDWTMVWDIVQNKLPSLNREIAVLMRSVSV
ncbi:MAG: DUF86 domain-containing protein [Chloroflexales bacterium]|nr:DUF86 domain-containing protein [Chloroflexales bacterium]